MLKINFTFIIQVFMKSFSIQYIYTGCTISSCLCLNICRNVIFEQKKVTVTNRLLWKVSRTAPTRTIAHIPNLTSMLGTDDHVFSAMLVRNFLILFSSSLGFLIWCDKRLLWPSPTRKYKTLNLGCGKIIHERHADLRL